jgi:hypothetical protein
MKYPRLYDSTISPEYPNLKISIAACDGFPSKQVRRLQLEHCLAEAAAAQQNPSRSLLAWLRVLSFDCLNRNGTYPFLPISGGGVCAAKFANVDSAGNCTLL